MSQAAALNQYTVLVRIKKTFKTNSISKKRHCKKGTISETSESLDQLV